jgi:hypothetical protein
MSYILEERPPPSLASVRLMLCLRGRQKHFYMVLWLVALPIGLERGRVYDAKERTRTLVVELPE